MRISIGYGRPIPEREVALVQTGRQLKSYACIRSLERKGIPTITASTLEDIPQFSSQYCSRRTLLASSSSDPVAYKDALLDIAARPDVLTAFPVREVDAFVFAKYRDEFEEHLSLVTPRLETLEKGHDRLRLAREAERAGVPYAETRLLSDVDEWDSRAIIKSRYNILTGEYVDGYPEDEAEEVKQIWSLDAGERPDVDAVRAEMNHEPISRSSSRRRSSTSAVRSGTRGSRWPPTSTARSGGTRGSAAAFTGSRPTRRRSRTPRTTSSATSTGTGSPVSSTSKTRRPASGSSSRSTRGSGSRFRSRSGPGRTSRTMTGSGHGGSPSGSTRSTTSGSGVTSRTARSRTC